MKKYLLFLALLLVPYILQSQTVMKYGIVVGSSGKPTLIQVDSISSLTGTDVRFYHDATLLDIYGAIMVGDTAAMLDTYAKHTTMASTYLPITNPTGTGTLTTPILKVNGGDASSPTIHSIDSISKVTGATDISFYDGADTLNPYIPYAGRIDLYDAMDTSTVISTIWKVRDIVSDSLAGYSGGLTSGEVATQINDTIVARLSAAVAGVRVSDTAAMLSPYALLSEVVGGGITASDTANMLANYILESEVVADYVAIADTTGFTDGYLTRYYSKGIYNVLDYGATGNGVTNDRAAIQAAVDACNGGTVYFPEGTYLIDSLYLKDNNTILKGAGKYKTTIKLVAAAAGNAMLIYTDSYDNITIKDMALDGNGANQTIKDTRDGAAPWAHSVGIYSSNRVTDAVSDNLVCENLYVHDFTQTGIISRGNNGLIKNCHFYNNYWDGFEFYPGSSFSTVTGCYFEKNTAGTLWGDGSVYSNNILKYAYHPNFHSANQPVLTLESSETFGGPNDCRVENSYFYCDSTFHVIDAENGPNNLSITNVTISGLKLTGSRGIRVSADTSTVIDNVKFYDCTADPAYSILLYGSQYATVKNCVMEGPVYGGIQLDNGADNNKIFSNNVTSTEYGIEVKSGCVDNIVSNNILGETGGSADITDAGTNTSSYNNYSIINDYLLPDAKIEELIRKVDSDTIPLFVFGTGSGAAADTALFNNDRLVGAFFNSGSDTLHVTALRGVLKAGTGTETIAVQVSWDVNLLDATPTVLNTSAYTVTSMTGGDNDTSFNNNDIPPNVWVWGTISGASKDNKPTFLSVTLTGYKRNRSY